MPAPRIRRTSLTAIQRWAHLAAAVGGVCTAVFPAVPAAAQAPARLTVHTYASRPPGSVNTHWIETDRAVVVIDGQRVTSEARRALAEIRRTGKPVVGILLTHPHPDHFGGLGVFAAAYPGVPIYATREAIRAIRDDEGGFIRLTEQNYGADFEERVTVPARELRAGERVTLAGVTFEVRDAGPGEGPSMAAFYVPAARALFPGDLIANARTPFLLEGRTGAWIAQLHDLARRYPEARTVYPGHGAPGDMTLVAQQLGYLTTARDLVARAGLAPADTLVRARTQPVIDAMTRLFPRYQGVSAINDLLGLNTNALVRELSAEPRPR